MPMNNSIEAQAYDWADLADVSHAAMELTQYACEVGVRCIQDDVLRMQFTQEVASVGKAIVAEVENDNLSAAEGMLAIQTEQIYLQHQLTQYLKLVAGLTAGVLQIGVGYAVCHGSVGLACGMTGIPMMLHGANNVYESARNIISGRTDTIGPVRQGYQWVAQTSGGTESQGNIAYWVGDLGFSLYSVLRTVVKPDAWRLFRYINTDKARNITLMSTSAKAFELGVDMQTGELIYLELEK